MKDKIMIIIMPNPTCGTCPISGGWFTILTGPIFRNFDIPNVAEEKDIENDSQTICCPLAIPKDVTIPKD